jgi:hypothetical protein
VYTLLVVGVITTLEPARLPGVQTNDVAGAEMAVSVAGLPAHTEFDEVKAVTGNAVTVTVAAAVVVPQEFKPVTVYVFVTEGLKAVALDTPPLHVYEFAPEAVNVTDCPKQIELFVAAILI